MADVGTYRRVSYKRKCIHWDPVIDNCKLYRVCSMPAYTDKNGNYPELPSDGDYFGFRNVCVKYIKEDPNI